MIFAVLLILSDIYAISSSLSKSASVRRHAGNSFMQKLTDDYNSQTTSVTKSENLNDQDDGSMTKSSSSGGNPFSAAISDIDQIVKDAKKLQKTEESDLADSDKNESTLRKELGELAKEEQAADYKVDLDLKHLNDLNKEDSALGLNDSPSSSFIELKGGIMASTNLDKFHQESRNHNEHKKNATDLNKTFGKHTNESRTNKKSSLLSSQEKSFSQVLSTRAQKVHQKSQKMRSSLENFANEFDELSKKMEAAFPVNFGKEIGKDDLKAISDDLLKKAGFGQ